MIHVGTPTDNAPAVFQTETQRRVYDTLRCLGMEFERVDCDPAITMEDCEAIGEALDVDVVKTLLLTNRQQTVFYILVIKGDKPFITRDFCAALSVPRVSFAPAPMLLEMLGTEVGATTILSLINDREQRIRLIIDEDVAAMSEYGCSDSTTTSYIRLHTADVLQKYVDHTGHKPELIKL